MAGTAQSLSKRPHQTPNIPEHPKLGSVRTFLTHQELHSSSNPSPRLQLQRLLQKTSSTSVSQLFLEPRTQLHTWQNPSKQGMNTLSSRQPAQNSLGRAEPPLWNPWSSSGSGTRGWNSLSEEMLDKLGGQGLFGLFLGSLRSFLLGSLV